MMLRPDVLLAILAMAGATFACRYGGYWLFRQIKPTPALRAALGYIPGALVRQLRDAGAGGRRTDAMDRRGSGGGSDATQPRSQPGGILRHGGSLGLVELGVTPWRRIAKSMGRHRGDGHDYVILSPRRVGA